LPIVRIPYDYYERFDLDPFEACRNILSIPLGAVNPFFKSFDSVKRCIDYDTVNPFDDSVMMFDANFIAPDTNPRYMHIDLAIKRDSIGVSMAHVPKFVDILRSIDGVERYTKMPIIKYDFIGKITADKGDELLISDVRDLIINEIARRGYNIRLISLDLFGSLQLVQTLSNEGYAVDFLSLDRTTSLLIVDFSKPNRVRRESTKGSTLAAWNCFRDAMIEGRIITPYLPALETEIKHAERRIKSGKVKIECQSKELSLDLLESMAGTCYNATNNEREFFLSKDSVFGDEDVRASSFYKNMGRDIESNKFIIQDDNTNFYDAFGRGQSGGDDNKWI